MQLGGNRQNMTESGGIDLLGHIMEATRLSPNKALYGDMHNFGHVMIAFMHDPDGRHLVSTPPTLLLLQHSDGTA